MSAPLVQPMVQSAGATAPTHFERFGSRMAPATRYRALRQAKGYSRATLGAVFGQSRQERGVAESNLHGPALEAALVRIAALPNVGAAADLPAPAVPPVPAGHTAGYPYLAAGRNLPGTDATGYVARTRKPKV